MHKPARSTAPRHQGQADGDSWRKGKTTAQRGYGGWWQRARLYHLSRHPLCVQCDKLGIIRAAEVVDHIIPHRGDQRLFRDTLNWQSLCVPCHNAKAAREGLR